MIRFCDASLGENSVFGFLHRERERLFPDEFFADLFADTGRRSVPPSVVATVMVLQRLEGLSDRDAVERFTYDARWRYAAGVGGYDGDGRTSFAHTVLVDMRARLDRSERPDRVFEAGLDAAKAAGLVGRRRVLDSTPLYDAVATMDTVTLIRSALRGVLAAADADLEAELRSAIRSGDDYATSAKPHIDWDDPAAREELIDSRAKDAYACLAVLDGRELDAVLAQAATLLATVVGQDLDKSDDGIFHIARKVAKDRVISTVDPEARHGHKTSARGFDGYKGHIAVDPDSEIITATRVTPGNAGDASVAADLIDDLLDDKDDDRDASEGSGEETPTGPAAEEGEDRPKVYGDSAYGAGKFQATLEDHDIDSGCKTQPPSPPAGGLFPKSRFEVNLNDDTVTCPGGVTVTVRRSADGAGIASFGDACASCPLQAQCTNAAGGRTIRVNAHEDVLARARQRQADPAWQGDYRATRPKVERKLAHLMRRKHGGRHARVRGTKKVDADFRLLGAAQNLARVATLGLRWSPTQGWATT
ncbi:MAG: transposase [Acidimicrobiia bacterium]